MSEVSKEALDFQALTLSGKKLLYNCDIRIQKKDFGLSASGFLRIGPLKGPIRLESCFGENGQWTSYFLQAPTFQFWEKYERQSLDASTVASSASERIVYSSSKNKDVVTLPYREGPWWDPLCLVLQLRLGHQKENFQDSYWTFSGPRYTEIVHREGHFLRKGKPLFILSDRDILTVQIPKFKLEFKIEEAPS